MNARDLYTVYSRARSTQGFETKMWHELTPNEQRVWDNVKDGLGPFAAQLERDKQNELSRLSKLNR